MSRHTDDAHLAPMHKFCEMVTYCKTLGLYPHSVGEDGIVLAMPASDEITGDSERRLVHTGAISTLIDSACGIAVLYRLEKNEPIATLDLRIDYLRAGTLDSDLLCRASCYRLTPNVAFVKAEVFQDSTFQRQIATSSACFMRLKPVNISRNEKHDAPA